MSYVISPNATNVTNTTNSTSNSASSSSANSGLASDAATVGANYNTFLSLLTAQIQNQDPLSPMDTTAWTTQLVQYSQVEQQLQANQYLSQIASASGNNMSSAADYIGKTVSATSTTATMNNGSATWDYNLASAASKVTLTVTDGSGNTVYQTTGTGNSGNNTFTWNGQTANGNTDTTGDYTLSITSTDSSGNAVSNTVGVSGVVTSAQEDNGTLTLTVGGTEVPLANVTSVTDTSSTASN